MIHICCLRPVAEPGQGTKVTEDIMLSHCTENGNGQIAHAPVRIQSSSSIRCTEETSRQRRSLSKSSRSTNKAERTQEQDRAKETT